MKLPIEGATITSTNGMYTATTNNKGRYRITRVASDAVDYTFAITCPGYQPVSQTMEFKAGTASRADFTLANVMKKTA